MTDSASTEDTLAQAQNTLSGLLEKMNFQATVAASWVEPADADDTRTLLLNVDGEDLSELIGHKGDTLASLQYLTRLMTGKALHSGINLTVDVQGYRQRRAEQLSRMAQRMAEQVMQRGRSLSLEPMPADERRLIHMELRNHPSVRTESVGEGERRKVTIVLK